MSGPTSRNSDAPRTAVKKPDDETKLRLFAEELSIAKEKRETGRVRILTRTNTREALVDEGLARERIEIEKVPEHIDAIPELRQEGNTTIIPVVEEQLVVERRLMLKEELRIRRVRTSERHQEKVMLRYQEAVITRQKDGTDKVVKGEGTKPEGQK
jgi:uncharacterized protein (TIGR02271 family)